MSAGTPDWGFEIVPLDAEPALEAARASADFHLKGYREALDAGGFRAAHRHAKFLELITRVGAIVEERNEFPPIVIRL